MYFFYCIRFILLDVNAPSNLIEDSECMEDNDEHLYEEMYTMELESKNCMFFENN